MTEYAEQSPDQLYVNQKNVLSIDDYETSNVGLAAVGQLFSEFDDQDGSYTTHQIYIRDYVELLHDLNSSEIGELRHG